MMRARGRVHSGQGGSPYPPSLTPGWVSVPVDAVVAWLAGLAMRRPPTAHQPQPNPQAAQQGQQSAYWCTLVITPKSKQP